jgi:hypothetical protein
VKPRNRTGATENSAGRLMTLQQVSAEYGPPYTSLRDLVLRGSLPFVRFPGSRRIWVTREAVEHLIQRSTERVS